MRTRRRGGGRHSYTSNTVKIKEERESKGCVQGSSPVASALRRLKEESYEFEVSLGYIMSSRQVQVTQ